MKHIVLLLALVGIALSQAPQIAPLKTSVYEEAGQNGLTGGVAGTDLSFIVALRTSDDQPITPSTAAEGNVTVLAIEGDLIYSNVTLNVNSELEVFYAVLAPGTPVINVYVLSQLVYYKQVVITDAPAELYLAYTLVTGAGLSGGQANTTLSFVVAFRNQYNQPWTGSHPNVSMTLALPGTTFSVAPLTTDSVQVSYVCPTDGQDALLRVFVGDVGAEVEVFNSSATIFSGPPPADYAHTLIRQLDGQTGLTSAILGQSASFNIQLRDSNNQNVLFGSVPVAINFTNAYNASTYMVSPWVEGSANVTITPSAEGIVPYYLYIDNNIWNNIFLLRVTRGAPAVQYSSTLLYANPNQAGFSGGNAQTPLSFYLQLIDQYGANFSDTSAHNLTITINGTTINNVSAVSLGNGLYDVTYEAFLPAGPPVYGAVMNVVIDGQTSQAISTAGVSIAYAVADASYTLVWEQPGQTGLSNVTAGVVNQFTVQLYDAFNRPITASNSSAVAIGLVATIPSPGQFSLVTFTNTQYSGSYTANYSASGPIGTFQVVVLLKGLSVTTRDVGLAAARYDLSATAEAVTGLNDGDYTAGQSFNLTFPIVDRFNNRVLLNGLALDVVLGGNTAPSWTLSTPTWNPALSAYTATLQLQKVFSGSMYLSINQEVSVAALATINVVAAALSPLASYVVTPALSVVRYQQSHLYASDDYQNRIPQRLDFLPTVSFPDNVVPTASIVPSPTAGAYNLNLTSTQAGTFPLSVYYQGTAVRGSPFQIYFAPGPLSPLGTRASGDSITAGSSSQISLNGVNSFTVTSCDAYGNNVGFGGQNVTGYVTDNNGVRVATLYVIDHEDGTYTCTYAVKQVGSYWLTVTQNGKEVANSPFQVHTPGASSKTFSVGSIVGAVLGTFFGTLLLVAILLFLFFRRTDHGVTVYENIDSRR